MEGILKKTDTLNARQFTIAIRKLADSLCYGTDSSPFLGSGTEYVQSRQYIPGDPIRSIDWRVTARTNRYHVKEYETPKQMPCYLLIDTSASMTIASRARSKYALAVHLCGGLALACLDRVSPVGIVGVGEDDIRFPPSLSRDQILQWLHRLRHYDYHQQTSIARKLVEVSMSLHTKALIIILSDLNEKGCLTAIKRAGQEHDCAVIQLTDPAEISIPRAGFLRTREAESGLSFISRGKNLGVNQGEITSTLKRGGIDHLQLFTDQPYSHALRNFFKSRGILGRGAR
ncbi:MAG: DUF58 domain-containing protein [Planctomycetota bacterium]|nr:DUF58 domain-containing protein [Planctomycetota bacterium]